jgi:hypothetical protein
MGLLTLLLPGGSKLYGQFFEKYTTGNVAGRGAAGLLADGQYTRIVLVNQGRIEVYAADAADRPLYTHPENLPADFYANSVDAVASRFRSADGRFHPLVLVSGFRGNVPDQNADTIGVRLDMPVNQAWEVYE